LGHVLGGLSGFYIIEGKIITEEEKRENKAKLEVWYSEFLKRHEERVKNGD
jgi:hypothetical protein